jgi:hypothetical protein
MLPESFVIKVCPTLCTCTSQCGVNAGVVERCPYTRAVRYVAMGPTVHCSAERPISSPFFTYLLSLIAPRAVVWHDVVANSTWRPSSRPILIDLNMAHGLDELARAGQQQGRITIAFLALAWCFILLRTWTRTFVISSFGWDDATMILAGVDSYLL